MAKKQKKKRNKKYRQKYTTGGRLDMSKGGRVSYQTGGDVPMKPKGSAGRGPNEEEERTNQLRDNFSIERQDNLGFDKEDDVLNLGKTTNNTSNDTEVNVEKSDDGPPPVPGTPQMVVGYGKDKETTADQQRTDRIAQTAADVQAASQGQVPDSAVIAGISAEGGTKVDENIEGTKIVTQKEQEERAKAAKAESVREEEVATDVATEGTVADQIRANTFGARKEALDAEVEAAQTQIDEDTTLAKAAGVDRVDPIKTATVDIPEGALASRVTGTLSPGAMAQISKNTGTNLARVTRAKKQLRNAGLPEDAINELGNDPEALEDKLTQFTEQERGLIAGLPEEALVSNQMDSLLSGMENGEIPNWAKPAVASVEAMLARRGMSASTVGRDALFNAIIQSAVPLAQSNAQAIQQSVAQQRGIEAQAAEADAQRRQQVGLDRANKVFGMNMAQFSADQQTELANSKFLQSVGMQNANFEQQGVVQDALLMSQANLAEADFFQKIQIQNAQAFLQTDMANLNNRQQANVLKSQQNQQRLLSNQAADNAARQFNAASQNQTEQFMASLNAQMSQYNASQQNAMKQFNASQKNAAEARRAGRDADLEKFNAQLLTSVDQFNSQQDFARNQWNAQNAAAVEASNVQWRRQANTINSAAQNQINAQNAQNAYGMSMQSMAFLWQELRDQADFDFRAYENEQNRMAQIVSTAIGNEGSAGKTFDNLLTGLVSTLSSSFQSGFGGNVYYGRGNK